MKGQKKMKNQSKYVWSYAAYGGEPQYIQTPYGVVKNDAAYRKYLAQKGVGKNVDLGISSLEPQAAASQDDYETESAWGYPNSSCSPFYAKTGRPYNCLLYTSPSPRDRG